MKKLWYYLRYNNGGFEIDRTSYMLLGFSALNPIMWFIIYVMLGFNFFLVGGCVMLVLTWIVWKIIKC